MYTITDNIEDGDNLPVLAAADNLEEAVRLSEKLREELGHMTYIVKECDDKTRV
jgi:hypothetical protein